MSRSRVRRVGAAAAISLAAAAAMLLAPSTLQATPPQPGAVIAPTLFGIHAVTGARQLNLPSGSYRMAVLPSWREVETAPGVYNWTKFDGIVRLIKSWGINDIVYSFGGTPTWAQTTPVPGFEKKTEAGGRGSSYPPNLARFQAYVAAVNARYGGLITAYETWNEPTSPQFFRGTPEQMAAMTTVVYTTVKKASPSVKVTSGSVQTHSVDYTRFAVPYFTALAKRGWPVDVISGHFYPPTGRGMDARYDQLLMMRADVTRLGFPANRELWDSEVNLAPGATATSTEAVSAVTRTYLDALRAGYSRAYWYMFTDYTLPFLTVPMKVGDPATAAYRQLGTKLVGATFQGCTSTGYFASCSFSRNGVRFAYSWTDQGTIPATLPVAQPVCLAATNVCPQTSGVIKVSTVPVLTTDRLVPVAAAPTQPGAPTVTTVGRGAARLNWIPPRSAGTARITGYRVEVAPYNTAQWRVVRTSTGSALPTVSVSGLPVTAFFQFRVTALSAAGASPASFVSRPAKLLPPG